MIKPWFPGWNIAPFKFMRTIQLSWYQSAWNLHCQRGQWCHKEWRFQIKNWDARDPVSLPAQDIVEIKIIDDEIERNKSIYAYANGDYNSVHDKFVYFNIKFPTNFLLYLKSREWQQVEGCIRGFLAMLYWLDGKKGIMEEQIEKKTLRSMIKIMHTEKFKKFDQIYKGYSDTPGPIMRARYNEAYFRLLMWKLPQKQ